MDNSLVAECLVSGISGCISTGILNPFDVVKTRMQIQQPKIFSTLLSMYRSGGVLGLWLPGLAASLLRDFTVSSVRTGFYPLVRDKIYGGHSRSGTEHDAGLFRKILAACCCGLLASIVSNPIDIVKIRLMNNPQLYTNTFKALQHISATEGPRGLFRGVIPNVLRGSSIAAGELATYDHSKHFLKYHFELREGFLLHFFSSFITGLVATTVSTPFDVIKTRVMNDHVNLYKGSLDCLLKTLSSEGPRSLIRGWVPSYCRLGSWSFIFFPIYENMRKFQHLGYL